MDKAVEIDPKLFITCRICLENIGKYQIVPHIQMKIKYCFDIDTEPFDGLPQLICNKCHSILIEYAGIKGIFKEKQKSLISKLKNQQQDNVSAAQQAETNNEEDTCNNRTSSADRESCEGDTNQQQDNVSAAQQAETNNEEDTCNSRTSSADRESCEGDTNQQQDNVSAAQQAETNNEEDTCNSRTSSADRESCERDTNQQQDNVSSALQAKRNTEEVTSNSRTSSADRESCEGDTNQQQDNVSSAHQANVIKQNVMKRPRSLWKKDYIKHFVCRFCSKSYKEEMSISIHLKLCKLKIKYSNAVQNCFVELNRMGSRPNLTSSNENVVYRKDNIIHYINKNYYVLYTLKSLDDEDFTTTRKRKRRSLNSTGSNETLLIGGNSCKKSQHSGNEREKTRENEVICISDSDDDIDDSEFITVFDQRQKLVKILSMAMEIVTGLL